MVCNRVNHRLLSGYFGGGIKQIIPYKNKIVFLSKFLNAET